MGTPLSTEVVRGKAVLELGAGCGASGIAAWHAGASDVVLSDYQVYQYNQASLFNWCSFVAEGARQSGEKCPSIAMLSNFTGFQNETSVTIARFEPG
jgi:predicted nicotinamide N-methyase